ncbi:MAG: Flp family type IVb pilin [Proteobacteria bacterium]|nr:Flp family type IVb pilin [Pseudomonadota bacterium]MBU1741468.1 Flp family type IVb pilin [Pseudomonadota bacterium]
MSHLWDRVKRFCREDHGVSAVEYGLLLALIGAAIAATMLALGQSISGRMGTAGTEITSGGSG